jgi:hypothetical protein
MGKPVAVDGLAIRKSCVRRADLLIEESLFSASATSVMGNNGWAAGSFGTMKSANCVSGGIVLRR